MACAFMLCGSVAFVPTATIDSARADSGSGFRSSAAESTLPSLRVVSLVQSEPGAVAVLSGSRQRSMAAMSLTKAFVTLCASAMPENDLQKLTRVEDKYLSVM
eukprot:4588223-Pleurochrysis_carterae.AAC.3